MKKYKRVLIIIFTFLIFVFGLFYIITWPTMRKYSFDEKMLNEVSNVSSENLKNYVKSLSEMDRSTEKWKENTVNYILKTLKEIWIKDENIEIQPFKVYGVEYKNIIVSFKRIFQSNQIFSDNKKENYIIWAHYDTDDNAWADDNASGVAWLLEITRILNSISYNNIKVVFYANEEMPFFGTEEMWSYIHADSVKDKNIKLAIILEMIWYYSEEKNSQEYPVKFLEWFYPNTWNFIAIVSNFSNISEVKNVKSIFKSYLKLNNKIWVESINAPTIVNWVDFSDHRNYWKFNIPAIMITDTAFYRNKNYHKNSDTYEKLDYEKMREVVISTILTVLNYN
jgi:Zn-dependent M28 family amino/carboxypeptidase